MFRSPGKLVLAFVILVPAFRSAADSATDWPQFRGPQRNGISQETGILHEWPEGGPEEVWRRPLGEGYSGLTLVGDRLYTMYAAEVDGKSLEFAAAFDAETGKELWRIALGEKLDTEFGNGPRSTPAVDGGLVYVLSSRGAFAALSAEDGARKWEFSVPEKFGSRQPYWGYSTSALVDGDLLLVESGGREGKCYAALDKTSGETLWTTGNAPAGYNSPLPVDLHGKRQFIFVAGQKIGALDTAGKELWSHTFTNVETHAMPVFVGSDQVFVSGIGGEGSQLLRIKEDGVEPVWNNPTMRNHFSSSVFHGGTIFGFDNATLKAISTDSGEQVWAKRGLGKGSLIVADGHLVILSDRGKLVLAAASAEGWNERGSVQALSDRCWTAPTLSDGKLYLRNHTEMVCYDLKG